MQWVDYDNDHDLDLFMATQWGNPNLLFENRQAEGFRKVDTGALTGQPSSSTG